MGGLREFLIQLNKPEPVYVAGDVVSGQLMINLSKQKTFKKIKVELVGKGDVEWEGKDSDGDSETYSNHEEYVDHEVTVHQGKVLNMSLLKGILVSLSFSLKRLLSVVMNLFPKVLTYLLGSTSCPSV